MTDDMMRLQKEVFNYLMANVHFAFPGVVENYNPNTRRADIQPSLKRKLSGGKYMALPVLVNVPVFFPGSKKASIKFPLEEGDDVWVHISERSLDTWKNSGGKNIEDPDPRRNHLSDAIAYPCGQASGFMDAPDTGLAFVYGKQKILMDDGKVELYRDSEYIKMGAGCEIKVKGSVKINGHLEVSQ
jgi:hypothetical protein